MKDLETSKKIAYLIIILGFVAAGFGIYQQVSKTEDKERIEVFLEEESNEIVTLRR